MMTRILYVSFLGLLLTFSNHLMAHVPYFEPSNQSPFIIPMPIEKSIAIYSSFREAGEIDRAEFILHESDFSDENKDVAEKKDKRKQFYISSLVPGCQTYHEILPQIAIVGPLGGSFKYVSQELLSLLPFSLDRRKEGIYLLMNEEQGPLWYEKYSHKYYFKNNEVTLTIEQPGIYKIYIWEKNRNIGDYVLATGNKETWGIREIMRASRYIWGLWFHKEITSPECRKELRNMSPP
ncbi:MAG: hypothetical protein HQK51_08265 [Oligoflexia bacterium]|nr:hypothetical protein [Oligoflexia bacterium]